VINVMKLALLIFIASALAGISLRIDKVLVLLQALHR
jgi:hypothetical protein